ncbi:class F sortase [Arthrobacter sp. MDT1-48-3]
MQSSQRGITAALLAAVVLAGCAPGDTSAPPEPAPSISSPSAVAPVAPAADPAAPATGATGVPVQPADAALRPADAAPVALDIAGTDISVRVVDVGIDANDAMEIPDSFWEAGWYRYGPAPGAEAGNAVLAAHVDSLTEVMPFARLKDVPIGTIVTITLDDGRSLGYRVSDVRNIPKATLDGSEIFARDGDHQLRIITCGGEWLPDEGDYEDNVVLTALPL